MALIFMDSFDHYTTVTDKYDANFGGVINTGGVNSRTGAGNLSITGAFGCQKNLAHITDLLLCVNWNSNAQGQVMLFQNFDADNGYDATCVQLTVNGDGSLKVNRGPAALLALLGQTVGGLVTFNTYNCIAMEATFSATIGTVNVWVNGVLVLALTGVDTTHPSAPGSNYVNGFTLMGPGGLPNCYVDDVYALDCSTGIHTTFLGALKIYAGPPSANAAVAWTPLAGTNWSEVNEVPPDGDTSYNSSGNIGDIDQYVYAQPGAIPGAATVVMVQHDLDMRVDSGARTVGSVMNGAAATNPIALSNGYHIYGAPYDTPPTFPANFGPEVTA